MIFRTIRTLRYLRPCQWFGQISVRLFKYWRDPARLPGGPVPPGRIVFRGNLIGLPSPVPTQAKDALEAGSFTFLGETMELGREPDWDAAAASRLWRYNLHYFDWLWSLLPDDDVAWESARHFTLDWIRHHPPNRKACGWEPYPTSLRLLNWSLLFGVRHRVRTESDPEFQAILAKSLLHQAQWLERNLETHIQANHLLENVAALTCVHKVFKWEESDKSVRRIEKLLDAELEEQILGDGMHYERSPMYHLRILWLVEALAAVTSGSLRQRLEEMGRKMKEALALLRHPDGEIALLNDSALGIYADDWKGLDGDDGPWALPDAGYYGARASRDYVILDAGAIGPDYQPGHAHADFFSFELSLNGHRVVTDTGVENYEVGPNRSYDRSTAAHNTVEVEGGDSVEVWSAFRVGRRVRPEVRKWQAGEGDFVLEAAHDGYRHLAGKVRHHRMFSWRSGEFIISDEVFTKRRISVVTRIHFAPGVILTLEGDVLRGMVADTEFRIEFDGVSNPVLEESVYHPSFNQNISRTVLCLRRSIDAPSRQWQVRLLWDAD